MKMKQLTKRLHRGEKGVTLIELLIVLAILGIIAAVIVLNVGGFTTSGNLTAANTELGNVQSAIAGYYAENGAFPHDTSSYDLSQWISGTLKADYTIDYDGQQGTGTSGKIVSATPVGDGWGSEITFYADTQKWEKTR